MLPIRVFQKVNAMEIKANRDVYRSEIERKVGRIVLLSQQMELMLRILLTPSKIEGGFNDLKKNFKKRTEKIQSQTLGQLVGK